MRQAQLYPTTLERAAEVETHFAAWTGWRSGWENVRLRLIAASGHDMFGQAAGRAH
jgi:hypothetical protein